MKDNLFTKEEYPNNSFDYNEINLNQIYSFVFRNKKYFAIITIASIILFGLVSLIKKKTWIGEFQIIIDNKENTSVVKNQNIPDIDDLNAASLLQGNDRKAKTQVEVLKSPSVLMPIFEKLKDNKFQTQQSFDKYRFSDWLKNN